MKGWALLATSIIFLSRRSGKRQGPENWRFADLNHAVKQDCAKGLSATATLPTRRRTAFLSV